MELVIKAAAAALTAAAAGLIIKRKNPELTLLLGLCASVVILLSSLAFAKCLTELSQAVATISKSSGAFIAPVLKCVGIGIITKLSSELCKDSSQAAAASAVELAGTICALSVAMPLVMSMLKMIGGMV